LPALNQAAVLGASACAAEISIQNTGNRPSVAVVLFWGSSTSCSEGCKGPSSTLCSGPIPPGSSWHIHNDWIPSDAVSAVVYSFDPDRLAAAAPPCPDPGTCACPFARLFGAPLSECESYAGFDAAYSNGARLGAVTLAPLIGQPLAATVRRTCVTGVDKTGFDGYAGTSGPLQGAPHAGSSTDSGTLTYVYDLPWLELSQGASAEIHVQNAGTECASVELVVLSPDGCEPMVRTSAEVAPGQSWIKRHDALPTGDQEARGHSGFVLSSQPLTIVVDHVLEGALSSYSGAPRVVTGPNGDPLFNSRRDVAFAPAAHAGLFGWWSTLHVQNTGDVDEVFLVTLFDGRGDTSLERVLGPVCPNGSVTAELADIAAELPCQWTGYIRVQAFFPDAPISAPGWPAQGTGAPCSAVPTTVPTASATPRGSATPGVGGTPTPMHTPSVTPVGRDEPEGSTLWLPLAIRPEPD
jgi:hypothetical protein